MERARLAELLGAGSTGCGAQPDLCPEPGPQVVCEAEPARFQAAFAAAAAGRGNVFLADPTWSDEERRRMEAIVSAGAGGSGNAGADPDRGWLMIPSGGTGGGLKFARHDGWTLAAAAEGFRRHFGLGRVDALGLLPLHHVSGLMAWLRCVLTGGTYRQASWKEVQAGVYPEGPGEAACLSLVPTQLQRLVDLPGAVAWLRGYRFVFVGGGPVWAGLADAAAAQGIRISLGYGMTETAAMAAALLPEAFLAGDRTCGRALPHIQAGLSPSGTVVLRGESLFRGHYPAWRAAGEPFETEDLGEFDGTGRLRILGRRDALIITGGEKVDPHEIEALLRASGQFDDVAVVGVADRDWGHRVVACYPGGGRLPDLAAASRAVEAVAPHKRPKDFVAVDPWPRNAQGKINRARLLRQVEETRCPGGRA